MSTAISPWQEISQPTDYGEDVVFGLSHVSRGDLVLLCENDDSGLHFTVYHVAEAEADAEEMKTVHSHYDNAEAATREVAMSLVD